MAVVSIVVGIFVLYKVWTYSEEERKELYIRLSVPEEKNIENQYEMQGKDTE